MVFRISVRIRTAAPKAIEKVFVLLEHERITEIVVFHAQFVVSAHFSNVPSSATRYHVRVSDARRKLKQLESVRTRKRAKTSRPKIQRLLQSGGSRLPRFFLRSGEETAVSMSGSHEHSNSVS